MKKQIINTIKITTVFLIIATIMFSIIVSQDAHHVETCHEEHCTWCCIIHIAQRVINLAIAFVIAILVGVLIYFFLSRLYKEQKCFKSRSLVFQKVQFNE